MDNGQELYHYGVKGMKWGVRKKRDYVTVFQAQRNASAAANKARKESIADSRANGPKGIGSYQKANRKALNAKRKAYGESMAKDRAHNKQLRDERVKDELTSRDPYGKKRREQAKAREQRQIERNELLQTKGKEKVYKILSKIGGDLLNPVIMDRPVNPARQPWDEKPDPNYRGGRI